jgi:thiamine pyrophosphate-dependent acetolactate synthase large subunit-like protein
MAIEKQRAIELLAKHRNGAVSVTTMQAAYPWHAAGQSASLHIEAVACMGSASTLGLGIALGAPQRTVMVLDGDGSLLMQLGSLVTIAGRAPENLYHFVFANGAYESSGNQPLPGAGATDWCGLARAAGYRVVFRFDSADDLDGELPAVFATPGPVLIELSIARDDAAPRWVGASMAAMVQKLKSELAA